MIRFELLVVTGAGNLLASMGAVMSIIDLDGLGLGLGHPGLGLGLGLGGPGLDYNPECDVTYKPLHIDLFFYDEIALHDHS